MTKAPSEKQIESLLNTFQPAPNRQALDAKLADAPWNIASDDTVLRPNFQRVRLERLAVAALAITLLSALLLSAPVQTFAQQIASLFFQQGDTNSYETTYVVPEPTAMPNTAPASFGIASIDALTAQAPIDLRVPTFIPAGYSFEYGHFEGSSTGNGITMTWTFRGDDNITRFLNLTQTVTEPHGSFEAGADATIESISIDGTTGEYLRGSWLTTNSNRTDSTVDIQQTWDNNAGDQRLSWYKDGILYEVFYQASLFGYSDGGRVDDAGFLTRDDLITFAESLP